MNTLLLAKFKHEKGIYGRYILQRHVYIIQRQVFLGGIYRNWACRGGVRKAHLASDLVRAVKDYKKSFHKYSRSQRNRGKI